MTLTLKVKKRRLREIKVTKQVGESRIGLHLLHNTAGPGDCAVERKENPQPIKELAQKQVAVDEM